MSSMRLAGAAVLGVAALAACSSSSGPSSAGRQLAFQLATQPAATAPGMAALVGQEILAAGSDTIVVSQVQVVLRRIELERVGGAPCDTLAAQDDCEDVETGPVLLDLPLGAGASRQFTIAIDTGSYGKIQFQIHRPESSNDAAFIAANPDFDGVSIRMTGTYNGTPFTYTSDLDVEQEHDLVPPISVTDASGASLTLFVDLQQWFLAPGGGALIDPATANPGGVAESDVKSNIEASFNAFEDHDHNGVDDHSGV